ncbi:MAG: DUF1015 domain-containing protein [Eubacteriales bacterium]
MAVIIPFKGLRYNPGIVKNLADVVTPPYDVIDRDAQEAYYRKNPYNIIRLEYGRVCDSDGEGNNRYTRAAADYTSWLKEKVLAPEESHALYLYEHEFTVNDSRLVRTGLTCAVKLEPYEKGIILPHEETMPKHKADRLALMHACRANFSPIFSLYADPETAVDDTLRDAAGKRPPDISFTDENNEAHRLWAIFDTAVIGRVQELMLDKRVFLADGHHRYETALLYKKERDMEAEGGSLLDSYTTEPAYNYVMMTLVNLYDPGLVILPAHRLIKNVSAADVDDLPGRLSENFTLEEFPLAQQGENFMDFLRELAERGAALPGERRHPHVFGVYLGEGRLYFATLKKEVDAAKMMPPGKSPEWQSMDAPVLHSLIIERLLGVCGELRARGDHITYSREEEGALTAVDRGEYQAAFFLNPTLVEEVTSVAGNGEVAPQKSTYFYPKLISGLLIYSLD